MSNLIKVNLLPVNERKVTLSPIEQFHRTPLMWIVIVLMVAFVVFLLVPIHFRDGQLKKLEAKIQLLEPKHRVVSVIENQVDKLESKIGAFAVISDKNNAWARRINILSDLAPEGVWFTSLTLDGKKGLMIQGSVISKGGTEMVNVGRFVQDLRDNPEFLSALKDLQIESIKRIHEKEHEIVQFTLTGELIQRENSGT